MAVSDLRLYFDDRPADVDDLDRFAHIRVDQAIGLATEAELHLDMGADRSGDWPDVELDFAQPFRRIRVEVRIRGGTWVALIDGPVVAQRYEMSADADASALTLVVHDDSVLLNRNEEVTVYEDRPAHEIARDLFTAEGMEAEVDAVAIPAGSLARFVVRRGTAMQLLRELALQNGMFVYVRPGDRPGQSVGVFVRPDLAPSDLPELLLMGASRNVNRIVAEFDGLRPVAARANSIDILERSILSAEVSQASLDALGDVAVHDTLQPATTRLVHTRERHDDLAAAATAAVDVSSWAFHATGEVAADVYSGVLAPYQIVQVAGAGRRLSGHYFVSRVVHDIDFDGYRQQFTLRRNAQLDPGGTSLTGGIF